jgi:hypothetical protein
LILTPPPPLAPKLSATRSARAPKLAAANLDQSKGADTWAAYAAAYQARYGAAPVRNAKVNAQIAQLVSRLGHEEAPRVAAFYVGHNGQLYVRAVHGVDLLLRDAEGLRTQWAQGRQITQTQATMADRTATNGEAFRSLIEEARAREVRPWHETRSGISARGEALGIGTWEDFERACLGRGQQPNFQAYERGVRDADRAAAA